MVGLVSDVPALQSKLSVFSCQWHGLSQLDTADFTAPKPMGQRMLKCGKTIEWSDL